MAKQTFTTGQVLTAAQMTSLQQTAMLGGAASTKTTSYVLVAADAGTSVAMNSTSATTVTVNTGLFAAGDTVTIINQNTGVCTVTAGTATVRKAANASLALSQYQGGVLDFISASEAIFLPFDVGASASAFVGCAVTKSANQSIATATTTNVSWDVEQYDTDSFHDNSTNNARFTIPTGLGGKYLVVISINWLQGSGGDVMLVYLDKNGTTTISWVEGAQSEAVGFTQNLVRMVDLAAGDYVQAQVRQSAGFSINVKGGQIYQSSMSLTRLGA